uniref:Uncharacterized protein n=1 Tax=viral metagenome TaxID=1070528 RepID=A0A6C0EYW6_9ZZZZ
MSQEQNDILNMIKNSVNNSNTLYTAIESAVVDAIYAASVASETIVGAKEAADAAVASATDTKVLAKTIIDNLNVTLATIIKAPPNYWTFASLDTFRGYETDLNNYYIMAQSTVTDALYQMDTPPGTAYNNSIYIEISKLIPHINRLASSASTFSTIASNKSNANKVKANNESVKQSLLEATTASTIANESMNKAASSFSNAQKILDDSNTNIMNETEINEQLNIYKDEVYLERNIVIEQELIARRAANKIHFFSSILCDDSCKQNIDSYYSSYSKYNKNNEHLDITLKTVINETEQEMNREYLLLFVWFVITIIIVVLTIIGVLSNEMNNYVLFISLGFLIFVVFYIFKNIYKYFNV